MIDGAFRPNTKRLLDLLGGSSLYRSPYAAIRELLQNALDAVREQIAREMLDANETGTASALRRGQHHLVRFTLEAKSGGTAWLHCSDTGSGMSREIIENSLLVSGKSVNRSYLALKIDCEDMGVPLERTGRFGIGVLSLSMLSHHWIFRTRRSALCGDDPHGWEFETRGVGSFGELRPYSGREHGTTVSLELQNNDSIASEGQLDLKWTSGLLSNAFLDEARHVTGVGLLLFIKSIAIKLPCNVEVVVPGYRSLLIEAGWAYPQSAQMPAEPFTSSEKLLDLREWIDQPGSEVVSAEAAQNGLNVRVSLPRFRIANHYAPIWMDETLLEPNKTGRVGVPMSSVLWSYFGLAVTTGMTEEGFCVVDIVDSRSYHPTVNRRDIELDEETSSTVERLRRLILNRLCLQFLDQPIMPFPRFAVHLMGRIPLDSLEDDTIPWIEPVGDNRCRLRNFGFPMTGLPEIPTFGGSWIERSLGFHGRPERESALRSVIGPPHSFVFNRHVMIEPVWLRFDAPDQRPPAHTTTFPPALEPIDGVVTPGGSIVLNIESPNLDRIYGQLSRIEAQHWTRDHELPTERPEFEILTVNDGIWRLLGYAKGRLVASRKPQMNRDEILSKIDVKWKAV